MLSGAGWGVAFACGAVLGFIISVLGGGGALFVVPILVFVFDEPVSTALGASLAAVFASSSVGLMGHVRAGKVRGRVALYFGTSAMLGAAAGARLHTYVPDRATLLLFAAMVFLAAARMIFLPARGRGAGGPEPDRRPLYVALGLIVGVIGGLLGISGGFLVVPVLLWFAAFPLHEAIGTSVAVMVMSAGTGLAVHAAQGHVSPLLAGTMGGGAMLGALAGVPLAGRLPERPLALAFALLLTATGIYTLARAL